MTPTTVGSPFPTTGTWLHGSSAETSGSDHAFSRHDQPKSIVWTQPATDSRFARHAKVAPDALRRTLAIEAVWLAEDGNEEDLAAALYLALQRGRIWDCNTVVAHVLHTDGPVARILRLAELSAAPEVRQDETYTATAQMLDLSIHEASTRCGSAWSQIQPTLPLEIVQTIQHWVPKFYSGSWARSVFEKTMTREQYVQTLYNMHHYVRQTTQHLGRAVATADDRELRRHFIEHLNGEINHEIMIENDLKTLGVNPEYVMRHRVPNAATKSFMAIQETSIAFYHDPIMLMACPIAAEGISAHMPEVFVTRLREIVASWNIARPEKATAFLTSHTHTDGGDDGHWQSTVAILGNYLVDEATQRRFLCTLRTAADCLERSFNSNIDDLRLFAGVA